MKRMNNLYLKYEKKDLIKNLKTIYYLKKTINHNVHRTKSTKKSLKGI